MTLTFVVSLLWAVYLVVLSVMIIWQRRAPVATLSWILSLAALPWVGLIIFLVFGPQKIKRKRLRRAASKQRLGIRKQSGVNKAPPVYAAQMAKMSLATTEMPTVTCTRFDLLVDGGATYEAIFAAIEAATHQVHLEYYIYEPDRIGTALRDLLIRKAGQGVQVRLLIDALGSKRCGRKFLRPLIAAGAEVAFFHETSFRRLRPVINMRTHRKLVICDGKVGFTGGINITDEEDERINPHAYHDLHLQLEGSVVEQLQQIFLEDWFYTTGERPEPLPYVEPPEGEHIVQVLQSGPDNDWAPIYRSYLAAINAAEERILLTTPYFVPDEGAMVALTSAALRGVDVQVMVPRRSDSWIVTEAARSYFDELVIAGVQVWEYTGRMLHSKTLVVDKKYAAIGTANFDNRSFRLNFEVSVLAYGATQADVLAGRFAEDLKRAERVFRPRKISKLSAFGEAWARLFSPLL
ncbi:cardiolipin synthase [Silvimonas amylolytica]|uniref:Cardiolipin synthase n=1 Tax=Silvimonas amylolytica TaxID=449663 RepID=A0ABQ2PML7_9NEIS|nr:cardiolipin synthase [Silvimonas amylolytica]GGP26651.1 cardiolipin synthase [Silvimonas amylolytica]